MQTEDRTEGGKSKARLRSASMSSLPQSSAIPDADTFKQVNALLKEAVKLKTKVAEAEDRLDEIKNELSTVAAAYDLKGFRHGMAGFEYHGYTSRSTLNKAKLVDKLSEYGAPASLIDECYEPGAGFLSAKFVVFDLE